MAVVAFLAPLTLDQIFSIIALSFLLFLAGMELHLSAPRGRGPRLGLVGFALSFALALRRQPSQA